MAERVLGRSPYLSPWTGLGQLTLAEVWAGRGELLRAEEAARGALPMFAAGPVGRPLCWAVLGRSLLAQGRIGEALGAVEEAQAALRAIGGMSLLDIRVHLAAGEVYRAAGNPDAAREALAEGARQMARRVEQITEAAVRERFLMNVRDNVRLRQLGEAG
jgi:tetratricopeptide (TPR) repeat protein